MRTKKKWHIMSCLGPREQSRATNGDKMFPSIEYISKNEYSDNVWKPDSRNIEEAESSLRESGSLNYEGARALLGRYEYQKGNIEAALHVFEGINIESMIPNMKFSLAATLESGKKHFHTNGTSPMSVHAICLLLESIILKAKSLQSLGRFEEAAQSCTVILDIVESSLPDGFPENFGPDLKLQDTFIKAVELLPELWKLANSPHKVIFSYRRALLLNSNLGMECTSRIQKEFAIFLLYSGHEAPDLQSQIDISFVPRNNIEEAILLLMILLRNTSLKKIHWDPSILDHLSFALSLSGDLKTLATQVEGLLPGTLDYNEMYYILSLSYYGEGDKVTALNLLRTLLSKMEVPDHLPHYLLASRICGENCNLADEGANFARKALQNSQKKCDWMSGNAESLLGMSISAKSRSCVSDLDRATYQSEAKRALESAAMVTKLREPNIIYHLCLENAEERMLDDALLYAHKLLKLEGGSDVRGWLLMARIFSAQKRFDDAESVINAGLDQTVKWDQGELLRTKAGIQIAKGELKNAIETYALLLAILRVQSRSNRYSHQSLESETWHNLAYVYISLSQWGDAEFCLSKTEAFESYSASRCHATGSIYEGKGLHKEALKAFTEAIAIDSTHVRSLISAAAALMRLGGRESCFIARGFLTDALRLDRTNHVAWFNLGMLYKLDGSMEAAAAECFTAAAQLEETAPIEPFR